MHSNFGDLCYGVEMRVARMPSRRSQGHQLHVSKVTKTEKKDSIRENASGGIISLGTGMHSYY